MLLTWIDFNLSSTQVQPTFVYTALTAKYSVNAKLGLTLVSEVKHSARIE